MSVLARLIRNTPGSSLLSYFELRNIQIPDPINWNGDTAAILPPLLRAVGTLDDSARERIRIDAERVDGMSGEIGQTAIQEVASSEQWEVLRDIETPHARALWMFLHDSKQFLHAEQSAFLDRARRGRTWDGFLASPNLIVNRDEAHLCAFADKLQKYFREGRKVRVEVFDRSRPVIDGNNQLIQVTVYREGLPFGQTVFEEKNLEFGLLVYRPVYEFAFTYESATGVIEVVAQKKSKREELVKLFATELLDQNIEGKRIPLRHIDLSVFMKEREFITDPQDGIVGVHLRLVKFEPLGRVPFVTFEQPRETESIHVLAQETFKDCNPFTMREYRISEVILSVHFRRDHVNPRGRTIMVKLRHPNGCDLKDKTDKERKLGDKYLRRWGILKDVVYG
ncbi:NMD3 domain-containing protein [Azospirillaceae bacterium]